MKKMVAMQNSKPLYNEVKDLYEAELLTIPPALLADPARASQIAEDRYRKVVGDYAVTQLAAAKQDPAQRQQVVKALGVAEPDPGPIPKADVIVNRTDEQMLRQLGLSPEQIANTKTRFAEKVEG